MAFPLRKPVLLLTALVISLGWSMPLQGQVCRPSEIMTEDSLRLVRVCPGDGKPDFVRLISTDTSRVNYSYIVTDFLDRVLFISTSRIINFETYPVGTCRIWGAAHQDTLVFVPNQDVTRVRPRNAGCIFLSDNVITVLKDKADGGRITLLSGKTDTTFCDNTSLPDTIRVVGDDFSNLHYTYVLSNDSMVLDINAEGVFDVNGLPSGFYSIDGLSYSGTLFWAAGSLRSTIPALGCSELSNSVFIHLAQPSGGLVRTTALQTEVSVCPTDGLADWLVMRRVNSSESFNAIYLIVGRDSTLLGTSLKDSINLESFSLGTCFIYNLSYSGDFVAQIGDNVFRDSLTTACYSLSQSFVKVNKMLPDGGRIRALGFGDTLFVCPGDNLPDRYILDSVDASSNPLKYVVTNDKNVILRLFDINVIDFENMGRGTAYVYGVSFLGDFVGKIGDTLFVNKIAASCYDVSTNRLLVIRQVPDGGFISLNNGDTTLFLCENNTTPFIYTLKTNSGAPMRFNYVLTNQVNEIVRIIEGDQIAFDEAPRGNLRIWGMAYTGTRLLEEGDNILFSSYSNACYNISDNFIQVVKDIPFAGRPVLANGNSGQFFCLSSNQPTILKFTRTGSANLKNAYIITNSTNIIQNILTTVDSLDFRTLPAGTFRVWTASYTGDITLAKGQNLLTGRFSNDCYDISDQFIPIIRDNPFAGRLVSNGSFERAFTCPVNDNLDFVKVAPVNGVFLKYAYIVTDTLNFIRRISQVDSIDFGSAEPGKCRIYGVAYEGNFTARVGNNVQNIAFSDQCYDLTNTYIEVIKAEPPVVRLTSSLGDSVEFCVNDAAIDSILISTTDVTGIPSAFFLTNERTEIIQISHNGQFKFDSLPAGKCRIYGITYTGRFTGRVGNLLSQSPLSNDCFSIASNFIIINKVTTGSKCIVGIHEQEDVIRTLRLFPNPTSHILQLEVIDQSLWVPGMKAVHLLDLNGRVVKELTWDDLLQPRLAIPVNDLANGLYMVRITYQHEVWSAKWLKH